MKEAMEMTPFMVLMKLQAAFIKLLAEEARTSSVPSSTKASIKLTKLVSQFGVTGITGPEQSMTIRFNTETQD